MKSKFKGYMGKILDIDLTTEKVGEYNLSDQDRELFVGGRYLSTKILWDELKPGIDPLSDENILVVMTSPLTGTGAPCTSRYDISAKNPMTHGIGHSNSGGNFGIYLKKAGWDAIIVRGKAKDPSYIEILNDTVKIKKADHIWGLDTHEAQVALKTGDFKKSGTMVIGPAGENLVKYSCVVSQERVHGRTGMGAVMGSKNLKGIVAKGNNKIETTDKEKFKDVVKKWAKLITNHPATGKVVPKLGTAFFLSVLNKHNALPTKNFSKGVFADFDKISGETLAADHLVKTSGCQSCPIRCGRVVKHDGKEIKGPEYEILCLFGSNMLLNDMDDIIKWNYELDLLGLDGVSAGTVIGFAAELNEKGIWKNGIEFGKKENISEMFKMIAQRKGVGDDLAEGVKFLSEKYGGKDFAPHAKGLELPAYQPQAASGHALGYATANRGGCHLDGGYMIYFEAAGPLKLDQFHYKSKPAWVVLDQNLLSAISAGGNCLFSAWTMVPPAAFILPEKKILSKIVSTVLTYTWPTMSMAVKMPPFMLKIHNPALPHTKALQIATGMKMDFGKFLRVGDRGYNLERLFNLREGVDKKQDKLAKRYTNEKLIEGNERSIVKLDEMLPEYYKLRGWDTDGIPTEKTLKKLGLHFVNINAVKKSMTKFSRAA